MHIYSVNAMKHLIPISSCRRALQEQFLKIQARYYSGYIFLHCTSTPIGCYSQHTTIAAISFRKIKAFPCCTFE